MWLRRFVGAVAMSVAMSVTACQGSTDAPPPAVEPSVTWYAPVSSVPAADGATVTLRLGNTVSQVACWQVTQLGSDGVKVADVGFCGSGEPDRQPTGMRIFGVAVVKGSACVETATLTNNDIKTLVPVVRGTFLVPLEFAGAGASSVRYSCGVEPETTVAIT